MDTTVLVADGLVADGHRLIQALDEAGVSPRFAMWVYSAEGETWRLWIVPPQSLTDEREFYRQITAALSAHHGEFSALDAGDVDLRKPDHPAVAGIGMLINMPGLGAAQFTNNTFNGFFIPNGIALRVAL